MSYTDRVCCAKDASTSSEGCYIAPVPTPKPTAPAPTQAPTSASVVAGSVTLSGISGADIGPNTAVLQDAIARVAGVDTDKVTILSYSVGPLSYSVGPRRRLQTDVIVNFEINSPNLAASQDVADKLATAAADPTLVDTAIAEAASTAGAEAVFAGVTTESLSYDDPAPASDKKKKSGNDVMMIIIIVVVILFVFIAGIGIGFWQKSKSAAPQNQTAASAPPPPPMAVAEPVEPPLPGYVSGAQAFAMARGEEIEAGQPPPPPSKGLGSWFSRAEPEGEAAMAPEPEQAAEAEK